MILQRILAAFDRTISEVFRISRSGSRPGSKGAGSHWDYYGNFGSRYIIFRNGSYVALGGIFEIRHRYDASGKLLSRQLRFKAEREEGDVVLFSFSRGIRTQAIDGRLPVEGGFLDY